MLDGSIPTPGNSSEVNPVAPDGKKSPVSALSTALNSGAPAPNASNTNPAQAGQVEILPQFANLPKEQGVIRTLQSLKDVLMTENSNLKTRISEQSTYVDFAKSLTDDPEMQMSFIRTYQPDLLKEGSVEDRVTADLKKEFGNDFEPIAEDESKRGTKTNRYWRKYDTLSAKYENDNASGKGTSTLKELAEKRATEKKTKSDSYAKKISEFKRTRNLTDSDVKGLHEFMGTLEIEHFWDIMQFQIKFGDTGVKPNLVGMPAAPGSFPAGQPSGSPKFMEVEQYVTDILGPAPPKP